MLREFELYRGEDVWDFFPSGTFIIAYFCRGGKRDFRAVYSNLPRKSTSFFSDFAVY